MNLTNLSGQVFKKQLTYDVINMTKHIDETHQSVLSGRSYGTDGEHDGEVHRMHKLKYSPEHPGGLSPPPSQISPPPFQPGPPFTEKFSNAPLLATFSIIFSKGFFA